VAQFMSEAQPTPALDLSRVDDPDVRRALRSLNDQLKAAIDRQQVEIQALLEMMIEKHVGSIGEYRRHLLRLQQGSARSDRIHDAMHQPLQDPGRRPTTPETPK
jgi:hypothetical protein